MGPPPHKKKSIIEIKNLLNFAKYITVLQENELYVKWAVAKLPPKILQVVEPHFMLIRP